MSSMTDKSYKNLMSVLISSLPEPERVILSLYYIEQMTFTEIARIVDQDLHTVYVTYLKAIDRCLGLKQQ